ncbi:hypothetical protein B5566_02460 [Mycobacterium sp. MHSD3]|nr:hypothetical protein B5566_02460 [Mycobacterium sp. MHSD3]
MAKGKKLVIKHNMAGYAALRSAPGVRQGLEQLGAGIADACNKEAKTDRFKTSSQQGRGRAPRWRVTVITAGYAAIRHNAIHNTLIRNLKSRNG